MALLPTYLAAPLIRQGQLTALLQEYEPLQLSIFAVYASRKHTSSALRAMLDLLALRFPAEPAWDGEPGSSGAK